MAANSFSRLSSRPDHPDVIERHSATLNAGRDLDPVAIHIPPRPLHESIPLSFAQRRLWFLNQLEPDSPVYNRPFGLRLSGPLRIEILERSLNEIVRRHEVLRTSFRAVDGEPWQIVAADMHVPLRTADLSDLSADQIQSRLHVMVRDEARQAFDLANGPLVRVLLIRTAQQEHLLLTTIHHAAFDGWSSQILQNELSVIYEAFAADEPSPLPELPIQYADFAVWQLQSLESPYLTRQLSFWRGELADLPVLDLSNGSRGGTLQLATGGRLGFKLPLSLSLAIRDLARQERATLFMVLLAAFKLLLQRHSGSDDVAIGCPVAGRRRTEVETLIGCFVNTLVLRSDLSDRPPFRDFLARVRATTLRALSNQDVPFERVVEELQPDRSLSRAPFFNVFFQLRNYPRHRKKAGGLLIEETVIDMEAAGHELILELFEDELELSGQFIYNSAVLDLDATAHLAAQYEQLLKQIVESPDRSIDAYSLITPSAEQLLPDPAVRLAEPHFESVVSMFRTCADRTPEHVAVRCDGRAWTYGELARRVDLIARRLTAGGMRPSEAVGIIGPRSFGVTAGMMAVLAAGGVMVPISTHLPVERRRTMLKEAGVRMLLDIRSPEARGTGIELQYGGQVIRVDPETAALDHHPVEEVDGSFSLPRVAANDPAYIFFTSGTTGHPNGVLGVHKGLSHFLAWQRETFAIGPTDRCSFLTGLSFDPVLRDVFIPLTSGATLCIPSENLEPAEAIRWLESEQVTVVHTVPSIARMWLSHLPSGAHVRSGTAIPSLRFVFFAGEPLTADLVNDWRSGVGRRGEIVNLYGPTETTMVKCFYRVPQDISPGIQPVGHALPQSQALVLGPANRRCGINERGEIVLRTPFGTLGYVNRPDENQRHFFSNPFTTDPSDRLYRTGDVGFYQPDGLLAIAGRLDHQIKIHGVRIQPEEVAAVLTRHQDVESAVVLGASDSSVETILVAYVVARSANPSVATLRKFLSVHLPTSMIPSAFVFLDTIPLTPNGKVDRSRLPVPTVGRDDEGYTAPRTPEEEAIAEIWAEVLGRSQVGINDDLFDLGGHSLVILRIASRMRDRLGMDVPVRQFFDTPTVAGLAEAMHEGATTDDDDADELLRGLLDDFEALSDQQIALLLGDDVADTPLPEEPPT